MNRAIYPGVRLTILLSGLLVLASCHHSTRNGDDGNDIDPDPVAVDLGGYQPPPGYERHLQGIDFSAAEPVDQDYKAQFDNCDKFNTFHDERMSGRYRCFNERYRDPNNLDALLKFPDGTVFFAAKMALDVDGGYRPCAGSGGATNQCPTTFTYEASKGWSTKQKKKRWREAYANSDTLPFVVIPYDSRDHLANGREFTEKTGVQIGDVGVIVFKDKLVPVMVADGGPHNKIGEGSLAAFDAIGQGRCARRVPGDPRYCAKEKNYSLSAPPVLYFLFPDSKIRGLTPADANRRIRDEALRRFSAMTSQ